jgi:hypothetical protein
MLYKTVDLRDRLYTFLQKNNNSELWVILEKLNLVQLLEKH